MTDAPIASGNEYGQSDDSDGDPIAYNDNDTPDYITDYAEDAPVAAAVEREWLKVTGCPSYSPNDARAALKWVKDIEACLFPFDSYVKAIRNAVESTPHISLWEVYNNRNKYLNMVPKEAFRVQNTGRVYNTMTEEEREYAISVTKNLKATKLNE